MNLKKPNINTQNNEVDNDYIGGRDTNGDGSDID